MIAEVAVDRIRLSRRWWLVVSLAARVAVIAAALQGPARLEAPPAPPVTPRATTVELRRVPRIPTGAPRLQARARAGVAAHPGGICRISGETQIVPATPTSRR